MNCIKLDRINEAIKIADLEYSYGITESTEFRRFTYTFTVDYKHIDAIIRIALCDKVINWKKNVHCNY